MDAIFSFTDYKEFVVLKLRGYPSAGRGQYLKMAKKAQMQSSNLSQVFNGDKHLTLEQAEAVGDYLELQKEECNFFLLLVLYARAGTVTLKSRLKQQIEHLKIENTQIAKRLSVDRELSLSEKAVFYSNWYYSAIQILTFLPQTKTVDTIAKRLGLNRSLVQNVVSFLLEQGLCIESKEGLAPGTRHTHLEADSPIVSRHHGNWRIKAMEKHPALSRDRELSYSVQAALSADDAQKVRALCLELTENVRKVVDPSSCERVYCLNLDWFEL